jgi:hypothetical protein
MSALIQKKQALIEKFQQTALQENKAFVETTLLYQSQLQQLAAGLIEQSDNKQLLAANQTTLQAVTETQVADQSRIDELASSLVQHKQDVGILVDDQIKMHAINTQQLVQQLDSNFNSHLSVITSDIKRSLVKSSEETNNKFSSIDQRLTRVGTQLSVDGGELL